MTSGFKVSGKLEERICLCDLNTYVLPLHLCSACFMAQQFPEEFTTRRRGRPHVYTAPPDLELKKRRSTPYISLKVKSVCFEEGAAVKVGFHVEL